VTGLAELGSRRRVAFRGRTLLVDERGTGPTVGFVHGVLGCPGAHPLLDALAERYRVVAPSLPGCTGSDPCDDIRSLHDWIVAVSEIVDRVGLTGHIVVASSTGAMLALELAAVRPEAFSHVVVIAPFGLWDDADPVADPFGTTMTNQRHLLTADAATTAAFFDDCPTRDAGGVVDDGVARYLTRTAAASLVWPVPEHGLATRLHLVQCPVTLVWGSADRLVPATYLERFAALLPNVVDRHVVRGAGHLVDWDAPAVIAEIVNSIT
jgi:pimeloyl-ACP methyl ester carboxylesterase